MDKDKLKQAALAGATKAVKEAMDEGYCPAREDEQHCVHWWDDGKCCSCGHVTEVIDE